MGAARALTSPRLPGEWETMLEATISDFPDPACRAGRHRAGGAADQYRAGHPAAARRHRACLCAGHAADRIAARARAAAGAAAPDLFGERRDELARIPLQPARHLHAGGRLRDLHRLHGRGRHALSDRAAVGRRLPARRHRRAARRGRAACDRAQARPAAAHPHRARGRRARQRRDRADPLPLCGCGDLDRAVLAAAGRRHLLRHRGRRAAVRHCGRLGLLAPAPACARSAGRDHAVAAHALYRLLDSRSISAAPA